MVEVLVFVMFGYVVEVVVFVMFGLVEVVEVEIVMRDGVDCWLVYIIVVVS